MLSFALLLSAITSDALIDRPPIKIAVFISTQFPIGGRPVTRAISRFSAAPTDARGRCLATQGAQRKKAVKLRGITFVPLF